MKKAVFLFVGVGKGGVGKTTSALSLAGSFARRGLKTLLIDGDRSMNAGESLRVARPARRSYVELLECFLHHGGGAFPIAEAVSKTEFENLDLLAGTAKRGADGISLWSRAEWAMGEQNAFSLLGKLLQPLTGSYDFILFDAPPNVEGALNIGALCLADFVLSPIEADWYCLSGTRDMRQNLDAVTKRYRRVPPEQLIFLVKFTRTRVLHAAIAEGLRTDSEWGPRYLDAPIGNRSKELMDALYEKAPLCFASRPGASAEEYERLADLILERIGKAI